MPTVPPAPKAPVSKAPPPLPRKASIAPAIPETPRPSAAPPSVRIPQDTPRGSLAPPSTARGSTTPRKPSLAPARPTQLGPYEIVAKIAGGGMASIYLARAKASPDRVVAVKAMRHELLDDDNMDRMFMDEASLLQRLAHPNIVRIYEVGEDAGQRFIAMELLLGKTLANVWQECERRGMRLDPDVVAWVGAKVALALHHAHGITGDDGQPLRLVHRDVNPANVFLTFVGEVKLFDFGMAKAESRRAQSDPGIVKGKLPYLAPEQIMQLPIDHRADIFGLATSLWELATTRRLFARENDVETVKAVHIGPIPELSKLVPELPPKFCAIVHKALQRNRDYRYTTAAEMAKDLEAFLGERAALVSERAGAMLDELFPGERKRQLGWLKPAVTPAAPSRR